jgi:diadenylate cyclase
MPFVHWRGAVDFFVLAAAIYLLLRWARQARAVRIVLVILGLHASALLARDYDLTITSWVLSAAGYLAIAILLVVFQAELRHALMRLDAVLRLGRGARGVLTPAYSAVAEAAFDLAEERIGALIVIVRGVSIGELIQNGTRLGAEVSRLLLETIFQKTSPMHDGAVIIEGDSITRAGAVLPLAQGMNVPAFFGTRHRAALGLAERSDALVIAVSEERGTVTLMRDGKALEIGGREQLAEALKLAAAGQDSGWRVTIRRALTRNLRFKFAALALAAAIWGIALYTAGTSVRVVTVPVVFTNVPPGMDVVTQSADELDVSLRGSPLVMDSLPLADLTATFNLSGVRPGRHIFRPDAKSFGLPPGVHLVRVSPPAFSVRLDLRKEGG